MIQWAAAHVPELVGGSADLAPSTLTLIDGAGDIEGGTYAGRNFHFGIREHGMGAIVNGLNLHYLRAYGATFFTFSDYMKGAVRLAALMRLRRSSSTRTTRSDSARTAPRTSRSSTCRRSAPCRTCR